MACIKSLQFFHIMVSKNPEPEQCKVKPVRDQNPVLDALLLFKKIAWLLEF